MTRYRLDKLLHMKGLTVSRSQAESSIRLAKVKIADRVVTDPQQFVDENAVITLQNTAQYVSRAALKLASVVASLGLDFHNKIVLDVGSSTGGFTDYALQHGAQKVVAVDIGTAQLHPSLRSNDRIELHEKTDILHIHALPSTPDVILIDVSFTSLRDLLPHIATLCDTHTQIIAMVKPQFETRGTSLKHNGIIKNDKIRRAILQDFEGWAKQYFTVKSKADSEVTGSKGNLERFYWLCKTSGHTRA
jgi:23S rRNA (cytidine1920-2'-O)/16S rRNA (cytidine1409-2'-O)-methyltransferase